MSQRTARLAAIAYIEAKSRGEDEHAMDLMHDTPGVREALFELLEQMLKGTLEAVRQHEEKGERVVLDGVVERAAGLLGMAISGYTGEQVLGMYRAETIHR